MLGYPPRLTHLRSSSSHDYGSSQTHESLSQTGLVRYGMNSMQSEQVSYVM